MARQRFSFTYVWIFCVLVSLAHSQRTEGAPPTSEIDRFSKAYRAASTEFDRRTVCLEAIDSGVVARGRPVAVIDAIFGTAYAKKLPRGDELETGVVHFHPPLASGNDAMASAYAGWYLAFQFDSAGTLQNYHLSNLHK